jgi:glycopeptide antibiotics resistance protein
MRSALAGSDVDDDTDRTAARVALGLYLALLAWVILLKMHTGGFGDLTDRRALNLVPFGATGQMHALGSQEIALNVLVFVPLGVLTYLVARRRSARLLFPVIGTSLAFEIIQFTFGIGASDITDLITNTIGGLLGLSIGWMGFRLLDARAQRWLLVGLGVLLLTLAVSFLAWLQVTGVRFRL